MLLTSDSRRSYPGNEQIVVSKGISPDERVVAYWIGPSLSFSIGVQPLVLLCDFDNLKLANSRFSLLNFVNCIFF